MSLGDRYREIVERAGAAAERSGRSASEVSVVAVSKTFPVDVIARGRDEGIEIFGENRAQELKQKASILGEGMRWHFIGPLQSNKVRQVVGIADLIHSVDRFGLAEAIARRARSEGIAQEVLVEVNISGETSKHGIEPPAAVAFALEISKLEGINVRGLMTMTPLSDPEGARHHFRSLASLGAGLANELPGATHLSMGMSRDFEVAVEEGATIVRVGEAIFGPRANRPS